MMPIYLEPSHDVETKFTTAAFCNREGFYLFSIHGTAEYFKDDLKSGKKNDSGSMDSR